MSKLGEDVIAQINYELSQPGATKTSVAKKLGLNRSSVLRYCKEVPVEQDNSFVEREDGTATCVVITIKPIRTYEDAIAAAGVDLSVWYVSHWEATQWTTPIKLRQNGQDTASQQQQYRVKLSLKRIISRSLQLATDAIFNRFRKHVVKYPKITRRIPVNTNKYLGVLGLFDAHFGKLCWANETGKSYDLKKAELIFSNAVDDLISESLGRNIAQWLLPIGNDFYHIDNSRNTTYQGTPQDTDGRYAKIIETGEMAVVRAIERLLVVAPVKVIWVPGNHDPTTSLHLARMTAAWFRLSKDVCVDHSPNPRKYYQWGKTLLGFTHGNEEKKEILPSLMATEYPNGWAETICREWLCGHEHRERTWITKSTDTHQGTTVRVLRSLAGTDSWHHRKGFVNTTQSAEVYWYHNDTGYAGHAVVPSRN